jgi:MFS family permease
MALEKPNVIAMVFDTTLPELRSTAMTFMMFCQLIGSMIGPLAVGALIPRIGSGSAILWVCVVAWGISLLLIGLLFLMPKDIENLRKHMAYRSQLEARLESRK